MQHVETELTDGLTDLELRIAHRADQLAQVESHTTGLNLHCWLLAEREVLGEEMPVGRESPVGR